MKYSIPRANPGFFLGGGALINHIVFSLFCRIPVVLESRRSSGVGGGGCAALHPPPRSAPVYSDKVYAVT